MSPDRKIVFRQEQLYPSISSQRTGSIKTETDGEEVNIRENVKGKMAILMIQIIVSISRDAIYNTSLKYYNSKRKILSFLLIEINLIIWIFYFKFYERKNLLYHKIFCIIN